MKYGARNVIQATVKKVKKGDIMAQVEVQVAKGVKISSVLTADSLAELGIKPGDKVGVIVKAIHVLLVKE